MTCKILTIKELQTCQDFPDVFPIAKRNKMCCCCDNKSKLLARRVFDLNFFCNIVGETFDITQKLNINQ